MVEGTAYRPSGFAPFDDLDRLWRLHGVTAGVLVQPSFLGGDNSCLLAALRREPERLRGVVVAEPERPDCDPLAMNAAGARGFRFNLISAGPLPDLSGAAWRSFFEEAGACGWHVEIAAPAAALAAALPRLIPIGLPIVVDHFGLPDPRLGPDDPDWRACLDLAARHEIWIKLSAPYRLQGVRPAALLPRLRAAAGLDRLVWGSDWPWTRHEEGRSFAEAVAAPVEGVEPEALDRIRRGAAARLYGFA